MSWSCEDTERALSAGGERNELPDAAVDHLDHCETCAILLEFDLEGSQRAAFGGGDSEDNSQLPAVAPSWGLLEKELERERGLMARLRSISTRRVLTLVGLFVLTPLLLELFFKLRVDAALYPRWRWWFDVTALATLLFTFVALLAWPQQQPRWKVFSTTGSAGWWGILVLGLLVPVVLAVIGPAHLEHPASLPVATEDFLSRARTCFFYGSALAAPLAVFLILSGRFETQSPWRLSLIAATWGVLGNWVLLMHCPLTGVEHILLGHASIGAVMTIGVGILTLWFYLRSRVRDATDTKSPTY